MMVKTFPTDPNPTETNKTKSATTKDAEGAVMKKPLMEGFVNEAKTLEIESGDAKVEATAKGGTTQSPRLGGLADLVDVSLRSIQSAGSAIVNAVFAKVDSGPNAPFEIGRAHV